MDDPGDAAIAGDRLERGDVEQVALDDVERRELRGGEDEREPVAAAARA